MNDQSYKDLRAALSDGSFDFDQACWMNEVRALLAELDALRRGAEQYIKWVETGAIAEGLYEEFRAALAQHQGEKHVEGA